MSTVLYNNEILRLASSLGELHRLDVPDASSEKRSPVCGSRIIVDVKLDAVGQIAELGLETRACALGQASAAVMANHAIGRTTADLAEARDGLTSYLAGKADAPGNWPGLEIFAAALPHTARHAAIRLAFEAVADAAERAAAMGSTA